jgi:hypothetical protein
MPEVRRRRLRLFLHEEQTVASSRILPRGV